MWFILALITLLFWSGSDLMSKIGCQSSTERKASLKMVVAVGFVFGCHAMYSIFVNQVEFNLQVVWQYLPVSLLYISSMLMGYIALKYIELSISSPICNTSGGMVLLIYLLMGEKLEPGAIVALVFVLLGVLGLGYAEYVEDPQKRIERQLSSNHRYTKSWLALLLPILYCILDALGTFGDTIVLQKLDEDVANTAYEMTFFIVGILVLLYLIIFKKADFTWKTDIAKVTGGAFETIGQVCYIYAIAANPVEAPPIISAYCVASVIWSRIILKEKLSVKHYIAITLAIIGIALMGVFAED